jgi:ABC-type branched-subunit amino acid transport system substrate-binding protein
VVRETEVAFLKAGENARIIANPGPDFFPSAKDIVARARSKGVSTSGYFLYGYAAVQVFARLAAESTNTSGEALGAIARSGKEIPTAMGGVRFDTKGDIVGWRFAVWSKTGQDVAAVDVCKAPDCKEYDQCPRDCPTK